MNDSTLNRRSFVALSCAAAGMVAAAGTGIAKADDVKAQAVALGNADVNFAEEVEVLIVGAGLSGMMAAWEIASAGHQVLIAEQNGFLGGDAIYSAACMMCTTAELTKEERPEKYMDEETIRTLFAPYYDSELALDKLVQNQMWAGKWIDLLHYEWGYEFQPRMECPYLQAYFPKDGICTMYTAFDLMDQKIQEAGATYEYDIEMTTLIVDAEGTVCGARFLQKDGTYKDIKAGTVVIATGGYVSNQEWMTQYAPDYADLGNIVSGRTGEGIKAGLAAGGTLFGMGPVGNLNPKYEAGHMLGVHYPILGILPNGKRFYCETAVHNAATGAIAAGYHEWYTIFDDVAMNGVDQELLKHAGDAIQTAASFEELAEMTGIHPDYLQATFDEWASICNGEAEDPFGRTLFLQELQPPFYFIRNVPVRYKSLGGLNVDLEYHVLDADENPIPNLYACGCAAGTEDICPAAASGMIVGTTVVNDLA